MNQDQIVVNSITVPSRVSLSPAVKLLVLFTTIAATAAGVGWIAPRQPVLAIIFVLGAAIALAALVNPDLVTPVVVFILYTNAPAILVQFHGIPYIIGALVPALMIIPLVYYVVFRRQKLIVPPILYLVLIFYVIQILGLLVTKDIDEAFSNLIKSFVEGILLYFIVINAVRTPELLRRSAWAILAAGAIIGALGFFQVLTNAYSNNFWGFAQVSDAAFKTGAESIEGDVRQPRLAGSIGEQNRHAQVMLMLVPIGFYLILGERKLPLRIIAALSTGLITLGIATTFSRGAALGFALTLVFMVFMKYIKFVHLAVIVLGIALLLVILPQYTMRLISLEGIYSLISPDTASSAASSADGALEGRTTSMLTAALVFADHPWIGVGTGMFGKYYQDYAKFVGPRWEVGNREAHNLYLGLLAENGLLGFACFMAVVLLTIYRLAQTRKRWIVSKPQYANIATGFLLAIVTYLGTGIGLHFGYYRFFWLIMALAYAASYVLDEKPSYTKPSVFKPMS